ncbi:type II toxin-antitoxin system RelE/ParE family toxin [Marinobacter daepoensis]|uniref:type II toxin-antitoxin system RelE/ParE family toxin n=1 Tax=Marinobacter daepoensis TaxID=262077 RepID=UPI00068740AD|nr:type II toxin-antitoxin system RelE/ParE family toxin [Marinobacter daepoensis]
MKPWKVTLTDAALADLDDILESTLEEFGTVQLKRYTEQIERAIRELEEAGNLAPLLKHRSDIRTGVAIYPLARKGKPSPHNFYLRMEEDTHNQSVIILRVLHQRMDPEGHL